MSTPIHSASAPFLYIYSFIEGVSWARSNQSAQMQMKIKSKELGCGIQLCAVISMQIQEFFFLCGVFWDLTGYYLFLFCISVTTGTL